MTSFVGTVLNGLREIAGRFLQREPSEGIGRRLMAGWGIMIISSVGVAFLGLALGFNGFPLAIAILVGSSALLSGAGDLAFGHQRQLARRLRILSAISLVLAALALAAQILQETLLL